MINHQPPSRDENADQSLAVTSRQAIEAQEAAAYSATLAPAAEDPLGKLTPYLHGIRRHSLLVAGLGLLLVLIVAPLVWYLQPDTYTASAYLQVSAVEPNIVYNLGTRPLVHNAYELYQNTQQQLVTSPFVMMAALRDPAISNLPLIREVKEDGYDPIEWLGSHVQVRFPGRSEIMEVSLRGERPEEVTQIVGAVIDAYQTEVVEVELRQKREKLDEVDRVYAQKETAVRQKRTELKNLAERLGTGQTDALNLKQENALQVYSAFREQQMKIQFELLAAENELEAQKGLLEDFSDQDVSELEVALYADEDPIVRQLALQLSLIQADYLYSRGQLVGGTGEQHLGRYHRDYALVNQQYEMELQRLREKLVMHSQLSIQKAIDEGETHVAVLKRQEEQISKDVDEAMATAERYGMQSIDVEIMRAEIEQLERVLGELASERERLRVEVNSEARVSVLQQADVPERPDTSRRIPLTILASLVVFAVPMVGIAFWDSRARRVNTSEDVSRGLGLSVIGSVPKIPPRVIKRLGSSSGRTQRWRAQLTEAVDAVVARLLRKADLEGTRVVLVTSPVSGEAKTTLATQVAMSLVRNGHRTALVDFDLRRPTLGEVFGLESPVGVCEVLRGEAQIDEAVCETSNDLLSVVPAGRWDRGVMAALANGTPNEILAKLREQFDFVILDSSPVLPVADTRFVSQHVDIVLLSVLRDISRLPKIQAACEILGAFGVKDLETIVTGESEQASAKTLRYAEQTDM